MINNDHVAWIHADIPTLQVPLFVQLLVESLDVFHLRGFANCYLTLHHRICYFGLRELQRNYLFLFANVLSEVDLSIPKQSMRTKFVFAWKHYVCMNFDLKNFLLT